MMRGELDDDGLADRDHCRAVNESGFASDLESTVSTVDRRCVLPHPQGPVIATNGKVPWAKRRAASIAAMLEGKAANDPSELGKSALVSSTALVNTTTR